jgi:glutamyl-tRNA synthetase
MVKTRIAPSPTGYPHIGTVYQALFDFAAAKKHNGTFLVRIEDTDRARFVEGAEERVFAALDWFGLQEDESPRKGGEFAPYRQSERLDLYQKYAKQLVDDGRAYYCDCTPERLDEVRKKLQAEKKTPMYDGHCRELNKTAGVIRLKVMPGEEYSWQDGIRGTMKFQTSASDDNRPLIDDQVLMKSDGFPTYHLAVVVDDHLMQVTHVVRGEEWLPSTPKHILLYKYFNWELPLYFHTPLLRNPDKSKLSKRHGHTDVTWYREEGYLPDAILNFLALMGWTHPEEKEIFPLHEFIELFDLKDIRSVGPIFDLTKLTWMNQQYIQMKSDEDLKKLLTDFYPDAKKLSDETFTNLLPLIKTRMKTLKEFIDLASVFFGTTEFQPLQEKEKSVAEDLKKSLGHVDEWKGDIIFEMMKTVMSRHNIKMPLLYKLFTGKERGLPLPQLLEILGKEQSLALLEKAHTA